MRLKNLIYIAVAGIVTVSGLESCKKSAFDINANPNNPTENTISYDVILPAALQATGNVVSTPWGFLQNWMGYWARSGTYAPNVTEETYQITTSFGNGIWNGLYDNLFDYTIMEQKAKVADAKFYQAIAKIMKAHNFQMLVDVYGNIPYKEALKGNANPTPVYDKGDVVYQDLFRQLDTAITLINDIGTTTATNKGIRTNDIMFGETVTADFATQKLYWKKFANTLKLRMLVHLMNGGILSPAVNAPGINITNEFTAIATEGSGYLGAGQNAQVNPGYKSDKPNPFYNSYKATTTGSQSTNNVYYRANSWGINYYAYNGDPRISRSYEAGGNGLVGVAYGLPSLTSNSSDKLAGIGPGVYKTSTAASTILSSGESFFLQAEARQRGFITTSTAAALLQTAMVENFTFLGVANPATAVTTLISNNAGYPDVDITAGPVAAGRPGGGLFTIISQKWFALNGINTLEIWNDFRRVHYSSGVGNFVYGQAVDYPAGPAISVSPQNTSTKIPVRLLYPQTEYNYNPTNVGAQGTINQFTSRVFWDLQ